MKTIFMLVLLALFASLANAETYSWEDANGVHFTDNLSSVPEKYREKHLPKIKAEADYATPQVDIRTTPQNGHITSQDRPFIPQLDQYQANLDQQRREANVEQQRRAAELMRQQQARALAVSTVNAERAVKSFAGFMAIWLLLGFGLFISWVSTIVDIVKSDFISPSNKTVWMLLVLFLPLLGMLLYFVLGHSQKCNNATSDRNNDLKLNFRNNLRSFDGKDFDIH